MYNFTDLIARSYKEYAIEQEPNIAHFFYQEFYQVREGANSKFIFSKEHFFKKLIKNIQSFINTSDHNYDVDLRGFSEIYITPKDFKSWEKEDLKKRQEQIDDLGLEYDLCPLNWEEVEDAKHLKEALINGLNLKDPVSFIDPSDSISTKPLVLRKSNLEYLKSEAIRAREANNIEELDVEFIKKEQIKEDVDALTNLSDIKETVIKHFQFTLEINDRKKKQMLSQEEFSKLVSWVTYFLENNFELPSIDTPIMEVHISKTKIKSAFKNLILIYHPKRPKPKSFYTLVAKCFYVLQDETEGSIQKTSDPDKPVN